jgi:predicted nucleotidyltransferase
LNPRDPNVQLVEIAAKQLGPLSEKLVLVGGCTTGLLITDLARPPARVTVDVDLIVEVLSLTDYHQLQEALRKIGLREDHELTCRWRIGDLKIDIMPTDDRILGFTNRWYLRAVHQARTYELPSGAHIKVVSPPLFIATKLEAFHGRGKGDYAISHDIEDVIAIVDGRPELQDEISSADEDVRDYLEDEVDGLLADVAFTSTIGYHLQGDDANQQRIPVILQRLRSIAGI